MTTSEPGDDEPDADLIARFRELDDIAPPAGWQDRAFTRWAVARRKRWLAFVAGALGVACAGAAVLALRPCTPPPADALEVSVLDHGKPRGGARIHDTLQVRAPAPAPRARGELRLYLGTRLVAHCPGDAACGGANALAWPLDADGQYTVVWLTSDAEIPVAGAAGLDVDQLDARRAGAVIETREVTVSP